MEINLRELITLCRNCMLVTTGANEKLTCWCENVLNGWKNFCVVKFSCFLGRESFEAANVEKGQRMCWSYGENLVLNYCNVFGGKLTKQDRLKRVSVYITEPSPFLRISSCNSWELLMEANSCTVYVTLSQYSSKGHQCIELKRRLGSQYHCSLFLPWISIAQCFP